MTERTRRIQIRVSEDIGSRLDSVALDMGMAPATLASYALSEFIVKKEREKSQFNEVTKQVSGVLGVNADSMFADMMNKFKEN